MTQLENPDTLAPETDKGDTTGPVTIGMAVAVAGKAPEPAKPAEGAPAEPPPAPETRVAAVGDSDFATNAYLGVEGNRDLFMNAVELAGPAGKPDLDSPEGSLRSPADAHASPDHADVLALDRRHPRRRAGDRRLHVVEAAKLMGRLVSTLAMVLVLAGLAGYIYFLGDSSTGTETTKEKAFGSVASDLIEEVRIALNEEKPARADQDRRRVEARGAGRGRCRFHGAVVDHEQPVHARHRARRGREAVGPGAVRAGAGPHRRLVQDEGPGGRRSASCWATRQPRAGTSTRSCPTRRACSWCRPSSSPRSRRIRSRCATRPF